MDLEIIKMKLSKVSCNDSLTFEPRLQEYLRKKIWYQENNITPCISLEREFQINKHPERGISFLIAKGTFPQSDTAAPLALAIRQDRRQ